MKILGIETSCDETGVAIYDSDIGLISNEIYSQKRKHENFGGVIPELSSRMHSDKLLYLIKKSLKNTNININNINIIAYTNGPGLSGSLLIGAAFSKSISYTLNIPSIPINHLEGHIFSPMIDNSSYLKFPFICLLISGGSTKLIDVIDVGIYKEIGILLDDAVGETFDKIARLLGIKYPGGKKLSSIAKNGKPIYKFPKPINKKNNLNFSFSGLKTHISNFIKSKSNIDFEMKCNISRSFEDTVISILINKSKQALNNLSYNTLVIAGGVSSNDSLRKSFINEFKKYNIKLIFPKKKFCTDNGAMIAYAGFLRYKYIYNCNIDKIKKNKNIYINPKLAL